MKSNEIQLDYEHVKGYQLYTNKKLTRWDFLNEEMDQCAKDYWQQTVAERAILSYSTTSMCPVFIHNARVIINFKPFLYDSIYGENLGQCWVERKGFLTMLFNW